MNLKTEQPMMRKLIMPLLIILIGLNVLVSGCGIFSYDPPDNTYIETYENLTNQSIQLVFVGSSAIDSFNIAANSDFISDVGFVHNGGNPIEEFVDDLSTSEVIVRLYSNDQLQKEWSGPTGNFGETINDPFNYDAWKLELYHDENHEGTVIFTISENDLN